MKNLFKILCTILCSLITLHSYAIEYKYILNEKYLNEIYTQAKQEFKGSGIDTVKIAQGIILRFPIKSPIMELENLTPQTRYFLEKIEVFLAEIKNSVIIEVHTGNFSTEETKELKNWEVSTIIANKIEADINHINNGKYHDKIISVGYGEFLPPKNTSYNGGNYHNRVDIIILCNTIGE